MEVIVATGVVPRALKIQGSNAPQVLSYAEVLRAEVGHRVAVIGAAELALHCLGVFTQTTSSTTATNCWQNGSVNGVSTQIRTMFLRVVYSVLKLKCPFVKFICYNAKPPLGIGLGKTSGWVHRAQLKKMPFGCYVVCNIKP